MNTKTILALVLISLLLACTKTQTTMEHPKETKEETSIEEDIMEIDDLNEEININELDSIEQDLAEIDW
jgi:hypothetical protein